MRVGGVAALLTVAAVVLTSTRARADEPTLFHPPGEVPAAKKVTMYALAGTTAVATGVAVVSLVQWKVAESELGRFPSTTGGLADCASPAQCADMKSVHDQERLWGTMMVVSGGVAFGAVASLIAVQLLWPHRSRTYSARLTPAVTPHGASFGLQGTF